MKFGTAILYNVTKKVVEKKNQNCSYSDNDVINYVNFLKNYAKNWLKCFFWKINLLTARKKTLKIFFSAFETQDNIQIEYI